MPVSCWQRWGVGSTAGVACTCSRPQYRQAFIRAFEAEHGEITEAEMDEVARDMRARAVVVRGGSIRRPGMTLVLDAGALLAVERGNRALAISIKRERLAGRAPVTHGGVEIVPV